MTFSLRRSSFIAVCAAALIAGTVSAQAAPPAVDAATSVRLAESSHASKASPVSPIVVAVVTLGGRGLLRDAKVEALDAKGRVLQTKRSLSGGAVVFDRAKVLGAKSLRVTGGRSTLGLRNNAVLLAPMVAYRSLLNTNWVSPISTVASTVAKKQGIPYARALGKVTSHLQIPTWAGEADHARNPYVFHHEAFARLARTEGGVRQAVAALVKDVTSGAKPRTMAPTGPTATPRELGDWAGEMIITDVVQAASGETPEGAIGNLFGVESPTLSTLNDIKGELADIQQELVEIQNEMNAMLNELEKTDYDTLVSGLGTLPSNISSAWNGYQTVVDNNELSDTATLANYVSTWLNEFGNDLGAFDALFNTSGTSGILDQLFEMNQVAYPGWWDDTIVGNVQSTVDYWGTMQAQFSALLSESWNFDDSTYTATYISNNVNTNFSPTNADVYDTMPTTLASDQIASWQSNVVYELVAASATGVVAGYAGNDQQNHNASCSSLGSSHNFSGSTVVSSATVQGWWTAAAPPGWTVSSSSALSSLQTTQAPEGTSENALVALASGLPSAWAMVTSSSVPYIGGWSEPKVADGHEEGTLYYYTGWLWCGSDTVSLVNQAAKPTQWIENFMMEGGSNIPSGASLPVGGPVPVGVLVQQAGQFTYVNPTNLD